MFPEERKDFNNLPSKIKIYGTMTEMEARYLDWGVRWTLDKKIAEFWQDYKKHECITKGMPSIIMELEINKSDAIAFFNDVNQKEIIYIHKKYKSLFF